MLKKIINSVVLASLIGAVACGKTKKTETPGNILSKAVFTKVLMDFALAESAANMNIKNVAVLKIDSTYAFDPLKENKITKVQYDSTLRFYATHAELYKEVYEDVLTGLTAMQTRRDSLKTHPASK